MLIINLLFVHNLTFELPQNEDAVVKVEYLEAIDRGLGGSETALEIRNSDGKLEFSVGSAVGTIDGVTGCKLDLEYILLSAEITCDQGTILLK